MVIGNRGKGKAGRAPGVVEEASAERSRASTQKKKSEQSLGSAPFGARAGRCCGSVTSTTGAADARMRMPRRALLVLAASAAAAEFPVASWCAALRTLPAARYPAGLPPRRTLTAAARRTVRGCSTRSRSARCGRRSGAATWGRSGRRSASAGTTSATGPTSAAASGGRIRPARTAASSPPRTSCACRSTGRRRSRRRSRRRFTTTFGAFRRRRRRRRLRRRRRRRCRQGTSRRRRRRARRRSRRRRRS